MFGSLTERLNVHSCCGVKHVVFSYIHDFIYKRLRICISYHNVETKFKFTFISLYMGLKGKGRWIPPLRCFLTYVVILSWQFKVSFTKSLLHHGRCKNFRVCPRAIFSSPSVQLLLILE